MNHRRHTPNLGFSTVALIILAVAILATNGIGFVMMKNRQYTVRDQIEATGRKMSEHKVSIALHESDIEERLGYYRLREQLADLKSPLKPIQFVEVYQDPDEIPRSGESIVRR